jgi:hypothetical protein
VKLGEQGGFDLLHPRSYALFTCGNFGGNPLFVVVGQHGAIVLRPRAEEDLKSRRFGYALPYSLGAPGDPA